ncbi:MAG: winged helix-turn-helix domain-containing protein, partial [Bacilli bacterium]
MSFNLVGMNFNDNEAEFLDVELDVEFDGQCTFHNLKLEYSDPNTINYIKKLDGQTVVVINSNPEYHEYIINDWDMPKVDLANKLYDMDNVNVLFLIDADYHYQDRWGMTSYCGSSYLVHPVVYSEVIDEARRLSNNLQETIIRDHNFYINLITREIFYGKTKLKTGPKLFDLIVYFVIHPNKLITREELLSKVFGINDYLDDRSIDTNI